MAACEKCGEVHRSHRADGKPQCQAHRTKVRPYVQCGAIAMPNGCCYFHGGPSQVGPAAHAFKTGKHSKMFANRLAGRLLEDFLATPEPELSSFDNDIRLWEARRGQLLDRINIEAGSAAAWRELKRAMAAVQSATDAKAMEAGLTELTRIIENANGAEETWKELQQTTEQLRKLRKERVRKAQVETAYVPLEEMVLWARFTTRLAVDCMKDAVELGVEEVLSRFANGVNEFARNREIKQLIEVNDTEEEPDA